MHNLVENILCNIILTLIFYIWYNYNTKNIYSEVKSMGFRFRKSFKLGKNTRFNVNKKSVGFSFGTKGFRKSINTSGRKTTTFSIPGTGLSYVSTKSSKNNKRNHSASHSMSNRTSILSFLTAPVLIMMIVFALFIGCSDDSSKKEKKPRFIKHKHNNYKHIANYNHSNRNNNHSPNYYTTILSYTSDKRITPGNHI